MLPEQVDEMLKNYREYTGRCRFIDLEIQRLEREIEKRKRDAVQDLVLPGRSLDGMPRGNRIVSPTESAGMRLADGYVPEDVPLLQEQIKRLKREREEKSMTLHFVDAWLSGLNDKERWVIDKHVLQNIPWRETELLYSKVYGEFISKYTLKRVQKNGMEKIYSFAE